MNPWFDIALFMAGTWFGFFVAALMQAGRDGDANGKQKEWEERYNAKRKAQVEAAKAAIRAEDMEKGIFIPVSQLPKQEPRKATLPASAAV